MYTHILIATDGSEIAGKAMPHAIELAKALGAKLSAVTITEPYDAVVAAESHFDFNERSAENAAEIPFRRDIRRQRLQVSSVMPSMSKIDCHMQV